MGVQSDGENDQLASVLALCKAVKLCVLCLQLVKVYSIIRITEKTMAPINAEQNVQNYVKILCNSFIFR